MTLHMKQGGLENRILNIADNDVAETSDKRIKLLQNISENLFEQGA